MRMTQLRRAALLTLAAVTVATSSACFGSFHAARKVWQFNKSASPNKFVQEVLFLGMAIVPVYQIATALDVLVFNTVEFWTNENPIKLASRQRIDGRNVIETAVSEKDGVRSMQFRGYESDSLAWTTTMNLVPGTELMAFKTVFANGRVVSRIVGVNREGNPYLLSNHDSP